MSDVSLEGSPIVNHPKLLVPLDVIVDGPNGVRTIHPKDVEAEEVILEMAAVDETSQRVYQSWKTFLDGVSAYHRIAEDAFVEARNLPLN